MDTLRVDICYRPLRIGWAIKSDDFDAFRKVIRYSYALWGGRFNPILFVDHEDESSNLPLSLNIVLTAKKKLILNRSIDLCR